MGAVCACVRACVSDAGSGKHSFGHARLQLWSTPRSCGCVNHLPTLRLRLLTPRARAGSTCPLKPMRVCGLLAFVVNADHTLARTRTYMTHANACTRARTHTSMQAYFQEPLETLVKRKLKPVRWKVLLLQSVLPLLPLLPSLLLPTTPGSPHGACLALRSGSPGGDPTHKSREREMSAGKSAGIP